MEQWPQTTEIRVLAAQKRTPRSPWVESLTVECGQGCGPSPASLALRGCGRGPGPGKLILKLETFGKVQKKKHLKLSTSFQPHPREDFPKVFIYLKRNCWGRLQSTVPSSWWGVSIRPGRRCRPGFPESPHPKCSHRETHAKVSGGCTFQPKVPQKQSPRIILSFYT